MFHNALDNGKVAMGLATFPTLIVGMLGMSDNAAIAVFISSFLCAWVAAGCGVQKPRFRVELLRIHGALDDALGDTEVSHVEDDAELRDQHPTQWAAQRVAALIQELQSE